MNDEQLFAYGCNEYAHIECPATAVGASLEPGTVEECMATKYDQVVQDDVPTCEGAIAEPTAKEYWLEALEKLSQEGNRNDRPNFETCAAEFGKSVADELGWL